jgi:hypothetical protein
MDKKDRMKRSHIVQDVYIRRSTIDQISHPSCPIRLLQSITMSINAEQGQALSTRSSSGMVEIISAGGHAECGWHWQKSGELGTKLGPEK